MKNALDLMGLGEFEGKLIGLVGVPGGSMGALASLRSIGRVLHAWVIPEQVSIPQVYNVFDKVGNVRSTEVEQRLREVVRQLARFAYLHTSQAALEFMREWERAPVNPGGRRIGSFRSRALSFT